MASPTPLSSLQQWDYELSRFPDQVFIDDLNATALVGIDAFGNVKAQPVKISTVIPVVGTITSAAEADEVDQSTIHYGELRKAILRDVRSAATKEHLSLDDLASLVAATVRELAGARAEQFKVGICLPKASAWGTGIRYYLFCGKSSGQRCGQALQIENLRVHAIIGVNSHERLTRQPVIVNVWIDPLTTPSAADSYIEIEQIIVKTIEASSFHTLEALALHIISRLFQSFVGRCTPGSTVRVKVAKPLALLEADAPGVHITRSADSFREGFVSIDEE